MTRRKSEAPKPSALTPDQRARPVSWGAFNDLIQGMAKDIRAAIEKRTSPLKDRITALEVRLAELEAKQ